LAVANTKTLLSFSCIQVRKVPSTRSDTPLSPTCAPGRGRPFSISSSHSTHGATASATWMAWRMCSSDEPTSAE
jgi:hypothetical protein